MKIDELFEEEYLELEKRVKKELPKLDKLIAKLVVEAELVEDAIKHCNSLSSISTMIH
jgi:hypothetical protein